MTLNIQHHTKIKENKISEDSESSINDNSSESESSISSEDTPSQSDNEWKPKSTVKKDNKLNSKPQKPAKNMPDDEEEKIVQTSKIDKMADESYSSLSSSDSKSKPSIAINVESNKPDKFVPNPTNSSNNSSGKENTNKNGNSNGMKPRRRIKVIDSDSDDQYN